MELLVKLPDATGSGKSEMTASKLEKRISQRVHKIATQFQRYTYFSGFSYPVETMVILYDQTEETGSGKPKMAASKLGIRTAQLVQKISTKVERLYLYFQGQATRLDWCE